ncbi:hypothetical protein D3C72_2331450 [compost metagenome]
MGKFVKTLADTNFAFDLITEFKAFPGCIKCFFLVSFSSVNVADVLVGDRLCFCVVYFIALFQR